MNKDKTSHEYTEDKALYVTDTLNLAAYLIERGVHFVRSTWNDRGDMTWVFRACPEVDQYRNEWLGREEVMISVRSYAETRDALLGEIKNQGRRR